MNRPATGIPGDVRRDLPLAAVGAATTWLTMLAWRGFTVEWGAYMSPLIVVAIAVAAVGVALRAAPLSRRTGALVHVLVIAALVWLLLGGSLLHPISSTAAISLRIQDAWITAQTYQTPLPTTEPSIAPLMIPCGALALLLVDLLACWLRRVPLAGLPLLAVYCVPISVIGRGVSVLVFLVGAAGFLLMIFLQESAHVARWGRPLGAGRADPTGFGVSTGASRSSAASVGGVAVVLAVVLPLLIPTLHLDGFGLFGPGGGGGDGDVHVVNPVAKMNRDLFLPRDVPLLDVKTDDPDPSYLKIADLNEFDGNEWSSGPREIVSNQLADGILPPETGLTEPTTAYNYTVTATDAFDSIWLPTAFPASSVNAAGAWHYDRTTLDFLNSEQQTTAGLTWSMVAAKPHYSAYDMLNSLSAPVAIQSAYTSLPTSLSNEVKTKAEEVTKGTSSRFEQAKRLQDWFRSTGGFTYSLQRHANEGDGNQAMLHFLFGSPAEGGRSGYCQQFAGAFAVMARELDIPARVAVGFLQPTQIGPHEFQYSAHDMHAWPELYFQGSGWVRFEPTPGARQGSEAPKWTTETVSKPGAQSSDTAKGGGQNATESTSPAPKPAAKSQSTTGSSGPSVPWLVVLEVLVAIAIGAALALVPRALRRRRRTQRLAGLAEDAWAELRDSAVDLGVAWPYGRSPQETGHRLAAWFGHEPDGPPPLRPPRGRGLNPAAEVSLDRIVRTLERARYARTSDDAPGALTEDVEVCLSALRHGSSRGALRRAEWWPRTLFARGRRGAARRRDREPEAVSAGGVVDHVG